MTRWITPGGGSGGSSSSSIFKPTGSSGASGGLSVYHPSSGVEDAPTAMPGIATINPADPSTYGQPVDAFGDLFKNLKFALFGLDKPDENNQRGGLLGDIPGVGDIGRGASNLLGGAADVVGGALKNAQVLERVPSFGGPASAMGLDMRYKEITASEEGQKFIEDFKKEYGHAVGGLGIGDFIKTDILSNEADFRGQAIRKWDELQQMKKPELFKGQVTPAGSFMGDLQNLLGLQRSGVLAIERGFAGVTSVQGSNRLTDAENFVRAGQGSDIEKLAVQKWQDGTWTKGEALDFLSTHNAGYSHDPGQNLIGELLLDPTNIATFGAGFLAKAGASGLQIVKATEKAAAGIEAAEEALTAAKAAAVGAKGFGATDAVTIATKELENAKEAAKALELYHASNAPNRLNFLARAIDANPAVQRAVQSAFIKAGTRYGALEGTMLGRTAKVARTIIDPLHAIDLHMPGAKKLVDLASDAQAKTVTKTIGMHNITPIYEDLAKLDATGGIADQLAKDVGNATGNLAREGIMEMRQASEVLRDGGRQIMDSGLSPDLELERVAKATKNRDLQRWLRDKTVGVVIQRDWSADALQRLGRQLESAYKMRSAAEWTKALEKMSIEQRSYLKFAIYGRSNQKLLAAIEHSLTHPSAEGIATAIGKRSLNDLVLLSRDTPTRILVEDLLTKIENAVTYAEKAALIREAMDKYKRLRYLIIDDADLTATVDRFTKWLDDAKEKFPMQVTRDELESLHPEMQELQDFLGDGYSLGFKPEDKFLWGLERTDDAQGGFGIVTQPWVGHVADAGLGYQPGRAAQLNLFGNPILDVPLKVAAGTVDRLTAAANVLSASVGTNMVSAAARSKFVSEASRAKFAQHGLTEAVADSWWKRVHDYVREQKGYSGPRGLADDTLYKALAERKLIPQTLISGANRATPRDIMQMFLDAYDGDIRYIGLTQKLSGRAKAFVHEKFGVNYLGQISEHAWTTMKFLYNPIFQAQEKIEPWVLSAQRGISLGLRPTLNESDKATARLLERLDAVSVIRRADLPDQAEYDARLLHAQKATDLFNSPTSKWGAIKADAKSLLDVQGTKRLQALRTFRKGLGKEVRSSWEESHPGLFDDMKASASARAGRNLNDDDFAIQLMGENLLGNDVVINRLGRAKTMLDNWDNAIKPGMWAVPRDFGQMKTLDLDHIVTAAKLSDENGKEIESLGQLRAYIAAQPGRLSEVSRFLREMGADPDYVTRVENALSFSWEGFWRTAEQRFGLSSDDSFALQRMIAGVADERGMTPVDFMSQVFDPMISEKLEGATASMKKAADLRAVLRGQKGVSTREDLVRQMSEVFSDYLDPSIKRKLLIEFKPELKALLKSGKIGERMSPAEVAAMWKADGTGALADRILGYMDGKLPTAPHDVVSTTGRGSAAARDSATAYLRKQGVEPHDEIRNMRIDGPEEQAHYDNVAAAYGKLPEVPYERSGRIPKFDAVQRAKLQLKPKPPGVDDATYEAYTAFLHDTRAQWDHMLLPKSKGGMGLKIVVSRSDPYTADAAGRAAMIRDIEAGRLKVYGGESSHPLLTNEQNVMFRAVHDVYGHAASGFEFGPRGELNAAATHARMYTAEGRGALLTETHGQTAYNNFSNDVIPAPPPRIVIDPARPVESFEAQFPFTAKQVDKDWPVSKEIKARFLGRSGGVAETTATSRVGPGLRALPPETQHKVLQAVADFHDQFPQSQVWHVDTPANWGIHPTQMDHMGRRGLGFTEGDRMATVYGAGDEALILINPEAVGADAEMFYSRVEGQNAVAKLMGEFTHGSVPGPRKSFLGRPWTLSNSMRSDMWHEFGHVLDKQLGTKYGPRLYGDFIDNFLNSKGRRALSEYGMDNDEDAVAELFNLAFNPEVRTADVPAAAMDEANKLRDILEELKYHRPAKDSDLVGKTVREVNAEQRGSYYAPQKVGLLPQNLLDEFGEKFVGQGRNVETNADVARTAQYFGKWTSKVIENGLMKGEDHQFGELFAHIRGIPTDQAAHYDHTEAELFGLATQVMNEKWQDAFRLQYFSQERSMLERSLNHPMFGIYPASYMFGKIAPEMVRFLAQEPFGLRTGGLVHSMMSLQAGMAMQREFDPEFGDLMDALGHDQAISFAGFLLPSFPWEITASAPTWAKDLAAQGKKMADTGQAMPLNSKGEPQGFDIVKPAVDTLQKLNPLEQTLPWLSRAAKEVTTIKDKQDMENILAEPVQAADLGEPLSLTMQALREALSK